MSRRAVRSMVQSLARESMESEDRGGWSKFIAVLVLAAIVYVVVKSIWLP
jgi:hypothetical protein